MCSALSSTSNALILAALSAALVAACGTARLRTDGAFWQKAPGDPTVRVVPAAAALGVGDKVRREIKGKVADHGTASGAAADHLLVLQRAGGDVARIYYRIGANRRLPVAIGDDVRVVSFARKHWEDDAVDVGLLVYKEVATATVGTGGELKTREVLVAVVQTMDIVDRKELPDSLRELRATDRDAYHEAGTFRADCQEVRSHRHFRVIKPELVATLSGTNRSARYVAPGTRLTLDDGQERFDVLLLDNRHVSAVESPWCEKPEDTWSWAAVRLERPGTGADGAPRAGEAPREEGARRAGPDAPHATEKQNESPGRPARERAAR